jgi:hypothetical protein
MLSRLTCTLEQIKQFPEQQGTSFSWLVDLQANTNFNAVIKDNTGAQAFSAMASIVSGSDTRFIACN